MENPSCQYCGCKNIECLACCSKTGLFFCNGKGDTNDSHIIHHLKTMHFSEITLPKENSYHNIPFKCYICESTNVFQLGFMTNVDNSSLYIVCHSNCRDKLYKTEENIIQDYFQPLISDGYINHDVVSVPNPDEYETVSISRTLLVSQQIHEKLGDQKKVHNQLHPAKLQYQSKQDFVAHQTQFIDIECEEAKKVCSYQFKNINLIWKDRFHCQFKAPSRLFQLVKSGTFLIFQIQHINNNNNNNDDDQIENEQNESGYINKKHRNFMVDVIFDNSGLYLQSSKNSQLTYQVSIQFDSTQFSKQKESLQNYLKSDYCMNKLISEIILGHITDIKNSNHLKETIPLCELKSPHLPSLNSTQKEHLKLALSQRFSMILGPPGTGKTTMIAILCNSFVKAGIKPVLVCTQTDEAANVATLTVAKTGLKVMRFVPSIVNCFHREIDKYMTTQVALNHFKHVSSAYSNVELLNDQERTKVEKYELKMIQECDVLCACCGDIGCRKLELPPPAQFCTIIVDECCSVADCSLLVPVAKNCQQLILFGDVNGEMRPRLWSNESKSARYDLSLMERLMLVGLRPSLLTVQYRMNDQLAEYPSKFLYGNFLRTKHIEKDGNSLKSAVNWPNPSHPMFFWDVKSAEEKTVDGFSYKNDQELRHVSIILDSMLSQKVHPKEIGIISPCIGQKEYLIDKLPDLLTKSDKENVNDIEIGTIEDFQGKEKKIVIVSLTRANEEFDIGPLNDKNGFCVLLTRARCGLVIVGCSETFSKSEMWCKFIRYCESKDVFVEGELESLKKGQFNSLVELEENLENDFNDDEKK